MKKIVRLTENDLTKLVKRVIKESAEENKKEKVVDTIKNILTPSEIEFLKKEYLSLGKEDFKHEVDYVMNDNETELGEERWGYMEDLSTHGELSDKEYKLRHIVNKIIKRGGTLAMLGVLPAAMFVGGGAAVGLGIASLVSFLFKDAAFWNRKGGIHSDGLERSDEDL